MKRHFLTTLAFAAALGVLAVPAKRKPFVFRQPDGTELIVTLVGDEFEHYYLTAEGDTLTPLTPLYPPERGEGVSYVLVPKREAPLQAVLEEKQRAQRGAELRAMRNAELRAQRSTQNSSNHLPPFGGNEGGQEGPLGSPRELVLLVEYPDCRFTYPAETLRRMLCKEGFSDDGATGSARDYFSDQSRGLFTPDIEVVGPIMLPHPRAYYGTPTANMYDGQPWLMLTDAAPLVDDEVDFAQFDNDADGFVDNVFIFYAGQGQNDGGPLEAVWPHAANIWTYYGLDCTLDGVRLGSYACTNEVTATGRMTGIGTFCHEYSHVLGLPDLYSTLSAADCFSPGAYELMDSGSYNNEGRTPPNMSAYDRAALGWVMPEPLTAPETVVLAPTAPTAPLQLPPLGGGLEGADGADGGISTVRSIATVKPEEYYLLENRQQVGWDAYLPGHGMLIWHIDYDARAWADNQVNVLAGHQRVDLVEADGLLTKETQDGDPFPGARQTTAVNLLPWTGVPIDAAITEIREVPLQLPPFLLRQASPLRDAERGGGLESAEGLYGAEGTGGNAPGTGVVTFKFRGGGERIEAPVALAAEEVGPCGFTASWTGVPAITDYEVVVWRGQEALPLNVAAEQPRTEPSSGRWTATVGGLEPATTYRYGVVALDGERRSPMSNEVAFTTLPPTFDMLAPTDLAAEPCTMGEGSDGEGGSGNGNGGSGNGGSGSEGNDSGNGNGAAAWRLTWTGLDEAVAYEAEVYGHQQVAPEVVTLDFTGGLAALPEGWTTTSTQTSGVAGTFGTARPALMLQAGEWLQSPAFEAPIGSYSFWSKGDAAATLLGGDRQLRIANMGETTAYVDDVVVSYGGRTEQVGTVVYSTADKTAAWSGDPAGAMLVVPARDGALWWRVRGVRADGVRSAWSAEAALPLLEGIADVRMTAPGSGVRYVIPPFITISADGTKRRQ